MLLTLRTTMPSARNLGYLLVKHPDRLHEKTLSFGKAHVFFPEATDDQCTVALLLDIDPIGLSRKSRGGSDFALQPYVNDRPYVASSFLSVALARMFSTAMQGKCPEHPELAQTDIPLSIQIPVLPCRGGKAILEELFGPLGYNVQVQDPVTQTNTDTASYEDPQRYLHVTLTTQQPISQVLTHLYVLLPVLDDEKHYWVSEDEVEKLLQRGEGWLESHPAKEQIVRRYLIHQKHLTQRALEQLSEVDTLMEPEQRKRSLSREAEIEQPLKQNELRLQAVTETLTEAGCRRVLDLGCGEGKLMKLLSKNRQFEQIVGSDVSMQSLRRASERLRLDKLSQRAKERFELFQSSLVYRDPRFEGYDGISVVEVIEHLDPHRLDHFSTILFAHSRPQTAVITTPNADYNVKFERLSAGKFRHPDHRFEWTRQEFQQWAQETAQTHGYEVHFKDVGPIDETLGAPTQMGVFEQCE